MIKYVVLIVLCCSSLLAVGQTQTLLVPSPQEKTEINKLLEAYTTFVNQMSKPGGEDKKALSIRFMKESLAKGQVQTLNDVDTSGKKELLNFLVYMNRLEPAMGGTLRHSIDPASVVFDKMKYDQWRRFYYTEVKLTKKLSWTTTEVVMKLSDAGDSIAVKDTVVHERTNKLSFYIRYEKENNVSKNFRLWAMLPAGQQPELPALEPYQQWWSGLDAEWKTALSKLRKMDEYPRESDLERLTYQSELDFSKAKFTTYEPLSAFTNVQKLLLKEANIATFEPLSKMTGLRYLDISKTGISDISGVEKLTKLEEFYCVANQIATIQPVATVTSLLKFDCSENMLEDIEPVKDLVNMKELNISLNIKVKNIDPVRGLVNMEKISFRKIEIKDLTPLQGMKNLVFLDCFNTGITSLEPIRHLQKIFHLDLSNNKVTSLDPIKGYRYIINLYLNYSSVSDLSVVSSFNLLRELEIAGCPQISSLGGVHKLEYIKVLKCQYTKIGKDEVQRFKKNHPNCAITYY
jgi:Leucine-rich repeat (LRR) protein